MSDGEIKNYMKNEKKKSVEELSNNITRDKDAINESYNYKYILIKFYIINLIVHVSVSFLSHMPHI